MKSIRHCIVDTNTNKVVNIIEYQTEQVGIPPGFELESPNLLCVANDLADIEWEYLNGEFIGPKPKEPLRIFNNPAILTAPSTT